MKVMNGNTQVRTSLRLHLTNVAGLGATQLLLSLLPSLERNVKVIISDIHLPDRGPLAKYRTIQDTAIAKIYHRFLPNALSRVLECLLFSRRFDGVTPLLVFGDIPLRCNAPQTVFVQTPHLLKKKFHWNINGLKFAISRKIFSINAKFARAFIVQTTFMQKALAASYPSIANKIHVVAQPAPLWLLASFPRPHIKHVGKLNLIYPAAGYPHKNHKLLKDINMGMVGVWPVNILKITLPVEDHPAPNTSWIQCVGLLSQPEMIKAYGDADGLLFLSTDESYGLPLVEAMFMELPIICPDLPYAHAICGEGAIYFDPLSIDSLFDAVSILQSRLENGWRPNWTIQMSAIPRNWEEVAEAMINIACPYNLKK